jgi:hypothetical protein
MYCGIRSISLMICVVLSIGGCATVHDGGGPVPSFDVMEDLKALEAEFGSATAIKQVYENGATKEKRDKMIAGRLVIMNLRYLQFIKALNMEKQLIDTASDITILSLNLAGTAFTPAITKTILSAISAAVGGSKLAVDKHYYYEKTMQALIAAMNAQRKQALVPILEGLGKPLDVYPAEQAITDLDTYYHAGTLIGAVNAIQAAASEQEKASSTEIKNITRARVNRLISQTARDQLKSIGDAIEGLNDLVKARAVLKDLGFTDLDFNDISAAKLQLIAVFRNIGHEEPKIQEMYNVFKTNNLVN